MKKLLIMFFVLTASANAIAQPDSLYPDSLYIPKPFSKMRNAIWVSEGLQQFDYLFLEFGIGISSGYWGKNKGSFFTLSTSFESNLWKGVVGAKVSGWVSFGYFPLTIGINGVLYNKAGNTDSGFKPEIGYGFGGLHLFYGYLFMDKKSIDQLNYHGITLRYYMPVINPGKNERSDLNKYR